MAPERVAHRVEDGETVGVAPPPGPERPGEAFEWVYLWHWPIRAMHWIAALCVVVLAATGFYIGQPYFMTQGEPVDHYLMGSMRFAHFVAAGVLVATAIVRIYWLFVGNRFERWRALFPVSREDWRSLGRMARHYLMIRGEEAPRYMGHNPLQQISYTLLYGVAAIMVITGFSLYGQSNPGGFFHVAFGWVEGLFGGLQYVRLTHHLLTWVFLIFIPIHVYLTLRVDILENTGTISSMVSGGRFLPRDREFVDE